MAKKNLESEVAKTMSELDLQTKREVAKVKFIGKTIKSDFETIILKQPELRNMGFSAPLVIDSYETLRNNLVSLYNVFSDRELSDCAILASNKQLDVHAAVKCGYIKESKVPPESFLHSLGVDFDAFSLTEKGKEIVYALKKIDGKK